MKSLRVKWFLGIVSLIFIVGVGLWYIKRTSQVSAEAVSTLLSTCAARGVGVAHIQCLRQSFRSIVRPGNLSQIMQLVESHVSPDQRVTSDRSSTACHEVGHVIGEIAASSGAPTPYLIAACGRACGYGCAHGVMVKLLRSDPALFTVPDTACSSSRHYAMTRSDAIACHHGVGHAVAEYASYDIRASLGLCDRFGQSGAKEECATGVLMELFEAPTQIHAPLEVPHDSSYCMEFFPFAKDACIGTLAAERYRQSKDIRPGLTFCIGLPSNFIQKCIISLGSEAYFLENSDAEKIVKQCGTDTRFTTDCLTGAIISSLVIDATGSSGEHICTVSPANLQIACQDVLSRERTTMRSVQ